MEHFGLLSVFPPLVSIGLAILTRRIYLSLFVGIWMGWTFIAQGNPLWGFAGAINSCLDVFKDGGNTKVVLFCGLVGSLIALIQRSGGAEGFVDWISEKGFAKSPKAAQWLAFALGVLIFVESSITCLITGSVCRPIFDRFQLPRERLAYICDSTSAPICVLFPLNGWGAFTMGLLAAQGIENPFDVLLNAVIYNFYAMTAVAFVAYTIFRGKDFGPMARAKFRVEKSPTDLSEIKMKEDVSPNYLNLVLPMVILIATVPISLYVTGQGNFMKGSGSTAVFWAVLLSLVWATLQYRLGDYLGFAESNETILKGLASLIPLMTLMVFAFSIGATCKALGTGPFIAALCENWMNPKFLAPTLFVASGIMAFSTGTSWGTFATMIPIGIPVALAIGSPLPIIVGAILGGGVFGDHCSPISDTTIVSSLSASCDHISHVRTQLPYALIAALVTLFLYLVLAFFG